MDYPWNSMLRSGNRIAKNIPGGGVFHLEVIESGGFVKRQYKNLLFLDPLYFYMCNDEENMKNHNPVLKKT